MKVLTIMAVLCAVCLLSMGCTEKQPATIGQAGQNDPGKQTMPVAKAEEAESQAMQQLAEADPVEPAEIDGRLMQTEKGLAIVTSTNAYVVVGKDLTDMVGKTVKVTGTMAEVDGGQVIEVMTVTSME